MWLVTSDYCGLGCAIGTYLIVVFVYWGFIRIGIWEEIEQRDLTFIPHFILFQYHCVLIFWSHWKCMTTEPGRLPKQEYLNYEKLPDHLKDIISKVGIRMKSLEKRIQIDEKSKKVQMEILDKTDLRVLSTGAEDTSESSEEEDEYDHSPEALKRRQDRRKRRQISSSVQRSMDRLMNHSEGDQNDRIIDEDGKIKFSRMKYDFDLYQSIITNIKGFNYKDCKQDANMIRQATEEEQTLQGWRERTSLVYSDDLSIRQIGHIESVFQRICKKCETLKVPNSHHCSTCKMCIARMDHHCPWVNNCVGYWNQKFFIQFLIYVFLGSIHGFVLIAMKAYNCMGVNCVLFFGLQQQVIGGLSLFLSLLFSLFVLVMFYDQISCILDNMSTIDKLQYKRQIAKGEKRTEQAKEQKSWAQRIREVMTGRHNGNCDIWWLFPTDIQFPLEIEIEYF